MLRSNILNLNFLLLVLSKLGDANEFPFIENSKNLNSDYWRLSQVVRTNTNKKHPFSRFSTGNLQTLRDDPKKQGLNVRDELIKWYNEHYSANVMKLCVLGKGTVN